MGFRDDSLRGIGGTGGGLEAEAGVPTDDT